MEAYSWDVRLTGLGQASEVRLGLGHCYVQGPFLFSDPGGLGSTTTRTDAVSIGHFKLL